MMQPIGDREQVEQPLGSSTANSMVENSQIATTPVERGTSSMTRPAKRQKTGKEEDMRGGTTSFVLDEDQHKTLLQLERSFPEWPSRRSKEPQHLVCRNKWVAIAAEMRARFPSSLPVTKDTLMRICLHGRKQRELRELQRLKGVKTDSGDGDQEVKVAMQTLKERCDKLKSMLRFEKKKSALLKKQLRQEITQRMELLQVTVEATEEAEEGDATA